MDASGRPDSGTAPHVVAGGSPWKGRHSSRTVAQGAAVTGPRTGSELEVEGPLDEGGEALCGLADRRELVTTQRRIG